MKNRPLIVQSDYTILLETESPIFEKVRDQIVLFSELVKSPDFIHTYKISPLSLWNAASAKMTAKQIISILEKYSKYSISSMVIQEIEEQIDRFGAVQLVKENENHLRVEVKTDLLFREMIVNKKLKKFGLVSDKRQEFLLPMVNRGDFKLQMTKLGYPVADLAGYIEGNHLDINLRKILKHNFIPFKLRDYQDDAVSAFYANGSPYGGSGTIVLPCGSGKTIIGIGAITKLRADTLIISTNITAIRQWREELLDKTDIKDEDIGEYSGESKNIKPITIASYQIITYRKSKTSPFKHFSIFNERNWGLIIYDEVHLLPAPVFRVVSSLQSRRRLGLTATLIREDGLEEEVFALIGPKKFELPWKRLETTGWIAKSYCVEYRVKLQEALNINYAISDKRGKFRIASENPSKLDVIDEILEKHSDAHILIIGQYISQLNMIKEKYGYPIITGSTPNKTREVIYNKFKSGEIKRLIVSKVANFAVDLPDANVAIQVSGTFGSRQEEAQRLGRILRPKADENIAYFYTIVTQNTVEQVFARNRQLFLIEQGYQYQTVNFEDE
jgi:DNA excision repair protein ERCC-3